MSSTSTTYQKKNVKYNVRLHFYVMFVVYCFFFSLFGLRKSMKSLYNTTPNATVLGTIRCMWTYVHRTVPDTAVSVVVCVSLLLWTWKKSHSPSSHSLLNSLVFYYSQGQSGLLAQMVCQIPTI